MGYKGLKILNLKLTRLYRARKTGRKKIREAGDWVSGRGSGGCQGPTELPA